MGEETEEKEEVEEVEEVEEAAEPGREMEREEAEVGRDFCSPFCGEKHTKLDLDPDRDRAGTDAEDRRPGLGGKPSTSSSSTFSRLIDDLACDPRYSEGAAELARPLFFSDEENSIRFCLLDLTGAEAGRESRF